MGQRLINVFVAPAEVFDEVKNSPPRLDNWIVPLVSGVIVGIIYCIVVFSQPGIIQKLRQPAEQRIEKMVQDGKLSRQVADQQLAVMERFMSPAFMLIMGSLGSAFGQAAMLSLYSLLFWAVGTFVLRGQFDFMKAAEAVGLSSFICVPGTVVAMLLAVLYGNLAMSPGPVLLLKHFDPANPAHAVLKALNVFILWYLAVLSIALARFTGRKFVKAAIWPFGVWAALLLLQMGIIILSKKISGGI